LLEGFLLLHATEKILIQLKAAGEGGTLQRLLQLVCFIIRQAADERQPLLLVLKVGLGFREVSLEGFLLEAGGP
jgi:hypothetical protein